MADERRNREEQTLRAYLPKFRRFAYRHRGVASDWLRHSWHRSDKSWQELKSSTSAAYREFTYWLQVQRRDRNLLSATPFVRHLLSPQIGIWKELVEKPHFGALSGQFPSFQKLDYVAEQIHLGLMLKKRPVVLGLSSRWAATDDMEYKGRPLTGLDVLQSWAVLLNYGHLFGTFATEIGISFVLSDPKHKEELISGLGSHKTRDLARKILTLDQPYRLHQVLALLHLEPLLPTIPFLSRLLMMYLEPPDEKTMVLKGIFHRIRQLAYFPLHDSALDEQGVRSPTGVRQRYLLNQLYASDGVRHASFAPAGGTMEPLMDAVDEFHHKTLFASASAARDIFIHLVQLRSWWESCSEKSLVERINCLFYQPNHWPESDGIDTRSRFDYRLIGSNWLEELKALSKEPWPWSASGGVVVLPSPNNMTAVYAFGSKTPSGTIPLYHLARRLAHHTRGTWNDQQWTQNDREHRLMVWRSVARLGRLLLQPLFEGRYLVQIEPMQAENESLAFATIGDAESVADRLRHVANRIGSERREELLKTALCIERVAEGCGLILAFMGKVLLYDEEETATEIDIAFACLPEASRLDARAPFQVRWWLGEVKLGKRVRGAQKQRERIAAASWVRLEDRTTEALKRERIGWLLSGIWPGEASPPTLPHAETP